MRDGTKLTVYLDHSVVQISVRLHQDLRIPGCTHEQCVNARVDWDHETAGDLHSDEEAVDHDHSGEGTAFVIGWVGDVEVDVGDECTAHSNEHASEGKNWADEAFWDMSAHGDVVSHNEKYR